MGRPRKAPPEVAHTGPTTHSYNCRRELPRDSSGSEGNLEKMKIWRSFSRLDRDRADFRLDTILREAKGDWAWFFFFFGLYIVGQKIGLSQKLSPDF